LNQILKRQTSRSHYGSKVPAVTITVKDKEAKKNVKNIFLSMCDVKVSLTFTSLKKFLSPALSVLTICLMADAIMPDFLMSTPPATINPAQLGLT
jgi:hypothetical protein